MYDGPNRMAILISRIAPYHIYEMLSRFSTYTVFVPLVYSPCSDADFSRSCYAVVCTVLYNLRGRMVLCTW